MKSNTLNINSTEPMVIIPLEEYDYLKSLEDSIKHPERYKNIEDPDYLTPEEIVLVYETNQKIKNGDYSDFVSIDEMLLETSSKRKGNAKSKEIMVKDKKNVYAKSRKKSSKVS
ncbi:MAG: hypothetical protein IPL53_01615 [Ignavibacteria bacterium]|nr:hypothetical protein [Ignavibacteria bacterium]